MSSIHKDIEATQNCFIKIIDVFLLFFCRVHCLYCGHICIHFGIPSLSCFDDAYLNYHENKKPRQNRLLRAVQACFFPLLSCLFPRFLCLSTTETHPTFLTMLIPSFYPSFLSSCAARTRPVFVITKIIGKDNPLKGPRMGAGLCPPPNIKSFSVPS